MKYRILAVDDEEDILTLLEYNLKKAGFEFYSAKDGPEAIELAKKIKPDLIILDIMLPTMEGTEVCKLIKNDETISYIPVIMLTAKGEEIDRIIGFELGADDYITKPFSPRELILRIRAVLRRGKEEKKDRVISAGPFVIDTNNVSVLVNGKKIDFTKNEFKILYELVSSKNRVLSRETIMDRVWGTDIAISDRSVDTLVRRVRTKLGRFAKYIVTARGFGYMFKENGE